MSIGHLLMQAWAFWYFTSCAVYPPWAKIFQSLISIVDLVALSIKITSVNGLIIDLLKARCFVTVATFLWWAKPRIGKKRLVLPLLASPTRQCTFSLRKSWQKMATSLSLRLHVLQNLSEVSGLGERLWIAWKKCSRQYFANLIFRDGSIHKCSSLDGPARITLNLGKVIVHGQWLE